MLTYEDLMHVPEWKADSNQNKRLIGRRDMDELSGDQQKAVVMLNDFINGSGQFAQVIGKAGTGKTYMISHFIENLLLKRPHMKIAISAPTHKAVSVLRSKFDFHHKAIKYATLQSLLGIRLSRDEDQENFEQMEEAKITAFNVVIIDEASMIAAKLFKILLDNLTHTKVIFLGDANQLPPVHEPDSLTLKDDLTANRVVLEEYQRFGDTSPIIQLSDSIITNGTFVKQEKSVNVNTDKEGFVVINTHLNDDKELLKDLVEQYYCSDRYRFDVNLVKIICWRNKQVANYNAYIRAMIYEDVEDLGKITQGEKLITNSSIEQKEQVIANNNTELLVLDFDVHNIESEDGGINYYRCLVQAPDKARFHINIVHEDSEEKFNIYCNAMVIQAKKHKRGTSASRQAWRQFYEFKKQFADVTYSYATTTHKAQGSTYYYGFVDMKDLLLNSNHKELTKLIYTACTRASKRLYIIK